MGTEKTNPITESIAKVRAFVRQTSISHAKLAALSGLSRNSLRNLHKDTWAPTAKTLEKLMEGMQRYKTPRPSSSPVRAFAL